MTQGFQNIATHDITWDDVKEYISTGELYKLRRSKDETVRYRAHKQELSDEGISIIDSVLQKLDWTLDNLEEINVERYPNDEEKLKASFSSKDLFKLLPNDFPYMFQPNIIHLLVWSKIRLPIYPNDHTEVSMEKHNDALPTMNPEMEKRINDFLDNSLGKKLGLKHGDDYVWFINYVSLQSIRAISHIHLLVKCKDVLPEHTEETKKATAKIMNDFINNNIFESL